MGLSRFDLHSIASGANLALFIFFLTRYALHPPPVHPLTSVQSGFNLSFMRTMYDDRQTGIRNAQRADTLFQAGCSLTEPYRDWNMSSAASPYSSPACACLDQVLLNSTLSVNQTTNQSFRCFFNLDAGATVSVVPDYSIGLISCILVWNVIATSNGVLFYADDPNRKDLMAVMFLLVAGIWGSAAAFIFVGEGFGAGTWLVALLLPGVGILVGQLMRTTRYEACNAYLVLPSSLLVLSIVQQQRDVMYLAYVLLFSMAVVFSNVGCQLGLLQNKSNIYPSAQKSVVSAVVDLASTLNILVVIVFLSLTIPGLPRMSGVGFENIRGSAFPAVVLLLLIPLANSTVVQIVGARNTYVLQLLLEGAARLIITVAAILDWGI